MEFSICLLRLPVDCDPASFLSCTGIVAAPREEAPAFEPTAVVPDATFFPVENSPLERHEAIARERLQPLVSLVRMDHVLDSIIGRGVEADDPDNAAAVANSFALEAVLSASLASMRELFVWSPSRFSLIGLAHGPGGQRTTTINRDNGLRLGLHFDSWDMLPMPERASSRYRMAVNVGTSERAFLFVAKSGLEILLQAGTSDVRVRNATSLFRISCAEAPRMRVYRLRVPPGWAYVAPTDNLPHDGSTVGASRIDFSLHALADFRPIKRLFDTSMFFDLSDQAAPEPK